MGCDSTVDGLCLPLRLSVEPLSCAKRTVPMPGLTFGFLRLAHEARAVAGGADKDQRPETRMQARGAIASISKKQPVSYMMSVSSLIFELVALQHG